MNNITIITKENKKEIKNIGKIQFQCCWSLFKLLNTQYWNNPGEWFYDFIFSIIFMALFGFINQAVILDGSNNVLNAMKFKDILIGLITLNVISIGSFSMPSSVMEIKVSILMKRIGSTPIRPWMFILTTFIYYFIMNSLITLWSFLWILLLFGFQKFQLILSENNTQTIMGYDLFFSTGKSYSSEWVGLIISITYMNIISIFIGLFNLSTSKTSASLNIKGTMLYFASMLLSGMLFPLSVITNNKVLNVFSYLTPYRYSNSLVTISWLNGDIFNPYDAHTKLILENIGINEIEVIISFVIPIIFVAISIGAMIKFFKWSIR
ncbi:hypothetical protein [Malacoplasma muris]|uniref:hypothetical protein n=1 Tax=Malacoplasma muris TaxID=2119 RepID=UPI00398F3DF4